MAILNNSNAISSGGYDINNSLRFRASASAYLNRTLTTPTNNKIWTYSAWIKRGTIASSSQQHFFNYWTSGTGQAGILFSATTDTIEFFDYTGTYGYQLVTTQVFRDPSAWYHFVIAVDTTQATSANRIKMYLNGNQITAFGTSTYPSLNYNTLINSANAHYIGRRGDASGYFDGYIAEQNFIDGQALTPSSFGETDTTTGSWKPKAYTGTYGTNGFYLKFSDIATTSGSNAGLGKDFSGNANYWTTNNISVTAGTTYDAMIDSPTLTSATVANYAVVNPNNITSGYSITNGNLNTSSGTTSWRGSCSTIGVSSGKWYWEIATTSSISSTVQQYAGICNSAMNFSASGDFANTAQGWGYNAFNGQKYNGTSGAGVSYGATWTTGDIIGVALDLDAGTLTFYKNNVSQGTAFSSLPADTYFPAISNYNSTGWVNFGQRPFSYTPPTGFVRLNTYNLPDSTIKKGNTVMDATLYTGNGANRSITNAASFRPDFVWGQARSAAYGSWLFDAVRGATKQIESFGTNAESTQSTMLTAFNSDGFSMGTDTAGNNSGTTYVAWQWQAGSSTVTNTSGTISAQVRANTTTGFSVVTYTGTGANATVGHGLGVAPSWVIVKRRNTTANWQVRHTSITAANSIQLNLTNASASATTVWNSTAPTSTVFSIGTSTDVNASAGTYVAYCWAEIAGFSKFGSYTGNGSTDGPFVYTGFRPKFVMWKRTDTTSNWYIEDSYREAYNSATSPNELYPNLSNAEATNGSPIFLSNGFKLTSTGAGYNASGGTYIYMAFAENPFKNANAR